MIDLSNTVSEFLGLPRANTELPVPNAARDAERSASVVCRSRWKKAARQLGFVITVVFVEAFMAISPAVAQWA